MKILIIRTTLGQGGADRVAVNLLNGLKDLGYEVRLLLMKREGEFLNDIQDNLIVRSPNVESLWRYFFPLRRIIKSENPSVVFSLDGGINVLLGILVTTSLIKCRVIVSERNVLFPPGKNFMKYFFFNVLKFITYRYVDCITAVSEGIRNELSKTLLIKKEKIKVVNNPLITPDLIIMSKEEVNHPWFGPFRNYPIIVHAGRFVKQKDHYTLIKAFIIARKQIRCRLFLLGDGPLLMKIKKFVADHNLTDDVFFAGFDKNPFKYFAQADLFILSSRHEGMPGVLIQAMACGAPVIATNCRFGPNEIIKKSGENGILVPVRDPVKLAEAILTVFSDPELRQNFRLNGKVSVERFTLHKSVKSYLEAILGS